MYSIDINFLNDRPDYRQESISAAPTKNAVVTGRERNVMIAGMTVGVAVPALILGALFIVNRQNANLELKLAQLDNQLSELQTKLQQVEAVKKETNDIKAQTQALTTVFNQIKPWSALLEELQDNTPVGVQITSIQQTEPEPQAAPPADPAAAGTPADPAAAPATTPTIPTSTLQIQGQARSFDDVNDLVILLKRSAFLQAAETQLTKAAIREDSGVQIEAQNKQAESVVSNLKLPPVVEFTISTRLSEKSASELMAQLRALGAKGLITRIETLEELGVIEQ